jgi:hypothetical protein
MASAIRAVNIQAL